MWIQICESVIYCICMTLFITTVANNDFYNLKHFINTFLQIISLVLQFLSVLDVVRPIIRILYLQVAGGISCGEKIQESMIRECAEEASISEELARTATPAGCVRYCTETIL